MGKSLRLSEKSVAGSWRWCLPFSLLAWAGTIVGDPPKVEAPLRVHDFLDKPAAQAVRQAEQEAQTALEQAPVQSRKTRSASQSARETCNHWLATRGATQRAAHDPEALPDQQRTRPSAARA